jgi:hypothetical protein
MPRWIATFLFLGLTMENYAEMPFEGRWETVFRPLGELLYRASPVKAPTLALILLGLLALARTKPGAQEGRVRALDQALWLNLAALAGLFAYGLITGGTIMPAMLQVQVMLFLPFCAMLCTAGLQTEEDFWLVGRAVFAAALYRAFLVLYFAFAVVPGLGETPAVMTTHSDTILFATAVVMLSSWALEQGTMRALLRALPWLAFLLVAVHINNRRLAYVSIGASGLLMIALVNNPAFKRKLRRLAFVLMPIAACYVAVGWGSSSPLFAPVKAISTMVGDKQDASSMTRDIENYNLIVTLKPNLLLGLGFGNQYNEVSVAYSISDAFPIYRYIPHNTVLGLWAFMGVLGATAWWLCLTVGEFLAIRAYLFAPTPAARTLCAVAASEVVIYMLQGYGDMGFVAWTGVLLLGLAFAVASRLAVATGAYFEPGMEPAPVDEEEAQDS